MNRSGSSPTRARLRRRALALFLGVLLAGVTLGGWLYWHLSYVHGQEACTRCDATREVDRRGPIWMYSDPKLRFGCGVLCDAHAWQRSGCWEVADEFRYALPPRRE